MPRYRNLAILLLVFGLFAYGAIGAVMPPQGFTRWPAPKPVADLHFLDDKGKVVRLADFKGRVVLLNVWATWCPPCGEEMPALDMLQNTLGKEGLSVIPVSIDAKGLPLVAPYYREKNVQNLPMFFDPRFTLAKDLSLKGAPTSVLISRDGWEIGRLEGSYNWTDTKMITYLRDVLGTPN
jgi:thiol-disulfide isomerase/thioredoxin